MFDELTLFGKILKIVLMLLFGMMFLCFILSIMVFGIGTAVQELNGKNHISINESGKCFDKFGSEINNLTCDIKTICSEGWVSLHPKCEDKIEEIEKEEKCIKIPCENEGFGYNLLYDCFKCEKEGEEE